MHVSLLNKPIELYNSTKKICHFFNFPPDFHQRNGDTRWCACYKVYGVDKLSNNSNLFKKISTRPKLTLYLPTVENMVVMTGNNIHVENICLTRFSIAKHPIFKQKS